MQEKSQCDVSASEVRNSSATLSASQRSKPSDSWSPPAGQVVMTQGARWGIYLDSLSAEPVAVWSGSNAPQGNDSIIVSGGADRVQGGTGDDQIDGMGGNDVLEGGDGQDTIHGDGIAQTGFMTSLEGALHGADFLDGGAGDDTLRGNGGDDEAYGMAKLFAIKLVAACAQAAGATCRFDSQTPKITTIKDLAWEMAA
jgi:RTX calcium-binding nonapeptide repeat (4 copies)